jgi:hypothetical protein
MLMLIPAKLNKTLFFEAQLLAPSRVVHSY